MELTVRGWTAERLQLQPGWPSAALLRLLGSRRLRRACTCMDIHLLGHGDGFSSPGI